MKEYLNKPFPFIEKKNHQIIASLLFGVFIFLFLYVYQPFEIRNVTRYKSLYILCFALITFIVLLISFRITSIYLKTEDWTIKQNLIFTVVQFMIISSLNWLFHSSFHFENTLPYSFLYFVFMTVAVGLIPTLFLFHFIEKYLATKNKNIAKGFTSSIKERFVEQQNEKLQIVSKNKNESIKIFIEQFICAQSEGNYVKVFYLVDNRLISKLIRKSLSSIDEQLTTYPKIKRCHRSYIVNFEKVVKITGNARNFNLHIDKLDFLVPVSRSIPANLLNELTK